MKSISYILKGITLALLFLLSHIISCSSSTESSPSGKKKSVIFSDLIRKEKLKLKQNNTKKTQNQKTNKKEPLTWLISYNSMFLLPLQEISQICCLCSSFQTPFLWFFAAIALIIFAIPLSTRNKNTFSRAPDDNCIIKSNAHFSGLNLLDSTSIFFCLVWFLLLLFILFFSLIHFLHKLLRYYAIFVSFLNSSVIFHFLFLAPLPLLP